MTVLGVLALSVLIYTGLPVLYSLAPLSIRFVLLYAHLAAVLTVGGLLGAVYALPVAGVTVLAGQLAYCGFLFTAVVLMVVASDPRTLRHVVALTVAVDVLKLGLFSLSVDALRLPAVLNPLGVPTAPFEQSLRSVAAGGVLIVVELVLLMALVEATKGRLGRIAMGGVYVVGLSAVYVADGVLFPFLALAPGPPLADLVVSGVQTKALLAAVHVVPVVAFLLVNRAAVDRYASTPVPLRQAAALSRDPLVDRLASSERQAGRAEATVERILEAATSTVLLTTDAELRITAFNRGAQLVLGYTEEEVLGRSPAMFRASSRPLGPLWGRAADGTYRDGRYRTRDGRTVVLSIGINEIRDGSGLVGYLAAGEDVTERSRLERVRTEALERERQAVLRLQEADRVKDELVSTISHELRTPIASIQGYAEVLADGGYGDLTAAQAGALTRVERNAARLEALVDDLLLLARGGAQEAPVALRPTDLATVVRDACSLLDPIAARHRVAVQVGVPAGPVTVPGDARLLERLVGNLVGNAVKFTDPGGRVELGLATADGHAVLTVADSGIGIPEADLDRVFERFFRGAEVQDRHIAGSGLGLNVAHAIARLHGGGIDLTSEVGVGTTVTVRLPTSGRLAAGPTS